jgi:hypothetical protein
MSIDSWRSAGKTEPCHLLDTHALNHLFQKGKLPRKYTSHGGGRAFYVYARRSQGVDDPQICYEINHVGGVGTTRHPARNVRFAPIEQLVSSAFGQISQCFAEAFFSNSAANSASSGRWILKILSGSPPSS